MVPRATCSWPPHGAPPIWWRRSRREKPVVAIVCEEFTVHAHNVARHVGQQNLLVAHLVATSIDHSPGFRAQKMAIGFNDTLAKPFRKETLTELLGAHATAEAG